MNEGTWEPRELFERQFDAIQRTLGAICRRMGFRPAEAEEYRSWALLRLIDDDYAVLRKFEGRSSWTSYLKTVLHRMALDYRAAEWGRWRPSAAARRSGRSGVLLERLTCRDGFGYEEALRMLAENHGLRPDAAALEKLAGGFPVRRTRRGERQAGPDEVPAPAEGDPVEAGERLGAVHRAGRLLAEALARLAPTDREILALRFDEGMTVTAIADVLGVPRRKLYRRIEVCLRDLRRTLEGLGLTASEARRAVGWNAAAPAPCLAGSRPELSRDLAA